MQSKGGWESAYSAESAVSDNSLGTLLGLQ